MKFLLCITLLAALPAAAQSNTTSIQQACRSDVMKLCRNTQPGGGRIAACLESHQSELSAPCQNALPQITQCAQEVRKLCDSTANGDARKLRQCAQEHAAELSPTCRNALPKG